MVETKKKNKDDPFETSGNCYYFKLASFHLEKYFTLSNSQQNIPDIVTHKHSVLQHLSDKAWRKLQRPFTRIEHTQHTEGALALTHQATASSGLNTGYEVGVGRVGI